MSVHKIPAGGQAGVGAVCHGQGSRTIPDDPCNKVPAAGSPAVIEEVAVAIPTNSPESPPPDEVAESTGVETPQPEEDGVPAEKKSGKKEKK